MPENDEITLAPGSEEARQAGCTCPVIDNHYGKGYAGDSEKYGFAKSMFCPLHSDYPGIGESK